MLYTLKKQSAVLLLGDMFIQASKWLCCSFMSSSVNTADAEEREKNKFLPPVWYLLT